MVTNHDLDAVRGYGTADSLFDVRLAAVNSLPDGTTKADLTKAYDLRAFGEFDYALPMMWTRDFVDTLRVSPDKCWDFVWLYISSPRVDFPFPLTREAEELLEKYDRIKGTYYSRKAMKTLLDMWKVDDICKYGEI